MLSEAALGDVSGNETDADETRGLEMSVDTGEGDNEFHSASPPDTPILWRAGIPRGPRISEKNLWEYTAALNQAGADELTPGLRLAVECVESMFTQQRHIQLYWGASESIHKDLYEEMQAQATRMVKLGCMIKGMFEARVREEKSRQYRRASVHVGVQIPSSPASSCAGSVRGYKNRKRPTQEEDIMEVERLALPKRRVSSPVEETEGRNNKERQLETEENSRAGI